MTQNPIISRMLKATGTVNVSRLAAKLGITPQTIQPYKAMETVPDSWLTTLRESDGINPDYLLTGNGPIRTDADMDRLNPEAAGRKYETMVFHPNGKDRVLTDNPAAGLVTNASGVELPINHMIEHVLCPEVRPRLDVDGEMTLTGSGLALPIHRLHRWGASPAGVRSLQTTDGLVVFDSESTDERAGATYVIEHRGYLAVMRFELDATGATFAPLSGQAQRIPVSQGADGPTPRIMGKAVWIGKEL
jgi:hypothetical protein